MKEKIKKIIFALVLLLIVILLFTIVDYFIHGLKASWNVPEYYFRNKIIFGLLWGMVGFSFAMKLKNLWFQALIVAGIISVALQVKYFIEGYALNFVLLFLLFHFVILYFLLSGMFFAYKPANRQKN